MKVACLQALDCETRKQHKTGAQTSGQTRKDRANPPPSALAKCSLRSPLSERVKQTKMKTLPNSMLHARG